MARRFLMDPEAYLGDARVQAMSPAARGVYSTLFMRLYTTEEPGVCVASPRVYCRLGECTPEEWEAVAAEVLPCLDTTTRPGYAIQHGVVRTVAMQSKAFGRRSAQGRKAANARWGKGKHAASMRGQQSPGIRRTAQGGGEGERHSTPDGVGVAQRSSIAPPAPSEAGRAAVRAVAAAMPGTTTPRPPAFPRDEAWAMVQRLWRVERLRRGAMQFAGWLWKHRTQDPAILEAVLERCARAAPERPYAYFAANGSAFAAVLHSTNARAAEAEHEAEQAADAAAYPRRGP